MRDYTDCRQRRAISKKPLAASDDHENSAGLSSKPSHVWRA